MTHEQKRTWNERYSLAEWSWDMADPPATADAAAWMARQLAALARALGDFGSLVQAEIWTRVEGEGVFESRADAGPVLEQALAYLERAVDPTSFRLVFDVYAAHPGPPALLIPIARGARATLDLLDDSTDPGRWTFRFVLDTNAHDREARGGDNYDVGEASHPRLAGFLDRLDAVLAMDGLEMETTGETAIGPRGFLVSLM